MRLLTRRRNRRPENDLLIAALREPQETDGSRLIGPRKSAVRASLRGADLEGADFGRAILVETSLERTNLTGADLSRVTGLTWATVRDATSDATTKWPAGFRPDRPDVAGPLLH